MVVCFCVYHEEGRRGMTHAKDEVIPKKLKALQTKIREWHIRKKTGGANKHLNKIIAGRDAYVHAELVDADEVDEYIRENFIDPVIEIVAPKQREMFGER